MSRIREKKSKFRVITLGCKVNQYESDAIAGELEKNGLTLSSISDQPDLFIINTCSVTQKASRQARQAIRKAIREHPDAVICVTGCYAQSEPHAITKITGVDYIIGNSHKHNLSDVLNSRNLNKSTSPSVFCGDILKHKYLEKADTCAMGKRSRPFIKIQDGCGDFCTYCIVPFTRGPSRSRPIADILNEIEFVSSIGAKEVVLTGIHVGRYGLDLTPASTLLDLLNHILKNDKTIRIRISSIEPTELTDELLFFAMNSKHICSHFHIPLQSGDDTVLKKMNRPYTSGFFKSLVEKIHKLIPQCAIGVDIMIGFPGETDDAFKNTSDLIEMLPVSYLHIFPYSSRPATPASHFPNQIPPNVIKSRFDHITRIGRVKKKIFYQRMLGQTLDVIVEAQRDKTSGLLKGVSSNYVKVLLEGDNALKNRLISCQIKELLNHHTILGKAIS